MYAKDDDIILWAVKRVSDKDILWAIERLRDEWPVLFGNEAETLIEQLVATPRDDPQAVRQVADRILELLQANPLGQARVGDELRAKNVLLWSTDRDAEHVNNSDILRAVECLRDEWPALFGDKAGALAEHLAATPRDDPQAVRQVADHILELLQANPLGQARVGDELWIKIPVLMKGSGTYDLAYPALDSITLLHSSIHLGYDQLPGREEDISASTVMVCPVDATHYRRVLRQKGQTLYCPEHNVALVPEG